MMKRILLITSSLLFALSTAHAQSVYGLTAITITPSVVDTYHDTELDYWASLYYDVRTDGFQWVGNNWFGASLVSNPWAAFQLQSATVAGLNYQGQTNHYVRFYYTTYVNSTIVYEDPYGFGYLSSGNWGGGTTVSPGGEFGYWYTEDFYVGSTFVYQTAPPPPPAPPLITAVQDNDTWDSSIYAGTSGYLAIFGTSLTAGGETPNPIVTGDNDVALSTYWASDGQVNASYTVSPDAAIGDHSIALQTGRGTAHKAVEVKSLCFARLKYRPVNFVGVTVGNHAFWWIQNSNAANFVTDAGPAGTCPFSCGYLINWVVQGTTGHYSEDNASAATAWDSQLSKDVCTNVSALKAWADVWPQNLYQYAIGASPNSNTYAHMAGTGRFAMTAPPNAPGW